MGFSERAPTISSLQSRRVDSKELEHIAFSGRDEIAHGIFRSIPKEDRHRYANRYILNEVIAGGIKKLRKLLAASAEESAAQEKEFVDETINLFITTCRDNGTQPRELFLSLQNWSEELTRLSLLQEALHYYDEGLALGIRKYPDMYIRSLIAKASVLNIIGNFREAQAILFSLATRPYVIPDRNLIPDVLFNLGREALLAGDIARYKNLLFRGLRHFHTRVENRKLFVEQITKTYRRSFKVAFDTRITLSDKAVFFLHRVYFAVDGVRALKALRITTALKAILLGYVYCLNYGLRVSVTDLLANAQDYAPPKRQIFLKRRNALVTRAMGGIGDLLMMTPGFHEFKKRHPRDEIHLAIPKRYFPVFEGNPDVKLVDIDKEQFDSFQYRRWFNFTDCPASRVESRTAPKVKQGRIEIFARALGINPSTVRRMDKRPRYFVLPEERAFQINFWKEHKLEDKNIIGIQLRSDEVYRDYPQMQQLVNRLVQDYHVLVFDAETIQGYDDERITKIDGLSMRRAFALASACNAIIAPDSSFVHLAAAFDLPCVALFGPIDGHIRTRHYPQCKYLDSKERLGCAPCWRNEQIPCKLTDMRASVCMADISIDDIFNALTEVLQGKADQ
ncbi:MAG: glycosyltransferase family 9 protein [Bacteroidota bacterium]